MGTDVQAALADVKDCVVKITTYRKTGEPFDMLLALRPVVDAGGSKKGRLALREEVETYAGDFHMPGGMY